MILFCRVLIIVLFIALLGSASAWAQGRIIKSLPARPKNPPVSALPESVRRVERQTGGEVLRAEPMQRDGREVYRLKVLTSDGRVRIIQDDPSDKRGIATNQAKPKENASPPLPTSDSSGGPSQ